MGVSVVLSVTVGRTLRLTHMDPPTLAARDHAAWRDVLATHRPRVYAYLLRMTRSRGEAEELTQATFVKLWQHAARIDPATPLGPWLLRVAHNAFVSSLRARRAADSLALSWLDHVEPPRPPAQEHAANQLAEKLEAALDQLPLAFRAVILLCGKEGLTAPEAAHILGISADNVRARLSRARALLRVIMEQPATKGPRR